MLIVGAERPARWLITCDHATNRVPAPLPADLGISAQDMARHIAYDVGAWGLSERLAERLDAPLIGANFSRLVIDPNRGEDDPTLVMRLYDGTIIPANRHVDAPEIERRLATLHRPYHAALARMSEGRAICAIHSFTPCLKGRPPRPWQVGVLSSPKDRRLTEPMLAALTALGLCVGDNEPYAGHLIGDSIDRHALDHGRPNLLIEVRNDLISDAQGQAHWAELLAAILETLPLP